MILPDVTTALGLAQFIIYGGGSALIVGILLSWFGERWPWYQEQSPDRKAMLMKFGSAVVAVLAYLAITYLTPAALALITAIIGIVSVAVGAPFVTQISHAVRKANKLNVANVPAGGLAVASTESPVTAPPNPTTGSVPPPEPPKPTEAPKDS